MAGVYRLEITESEEKLKEMLGKQKTAFFLDHYEYVQRLRFTLPKNIDELRLLVKNRLSEMTKSVIASLVGKDSILDRPKSSR
jgi:hypothetical protein